MIRLTVVTIIALVAASCGGMSTRYLDEELGGTGRYELRITHELEYGPLPYEIVFPDELEAHHYVTVEDGPVYFVELSDGGEEVEIWPSEVTDAMVVISGRLDPDGWTAANVRPREHRRYFLDEGMLLGAGGHLLIWEEDTGLRAELTVYGSGQPMVNTWRGDLVPIE